ncbi:MAG: hypothetical protein ACOX2F_01335 [bacterium]
MIELSPKKTIFLFLLFFSCSLLAQEPVLINKVLTKINGIPITLYDLKLRWAKDQYNYGQVQLESLSNESVLKEPDLVKSAMEALMVKDALDFFDIGVSEEDVDAAIDIMKREFELKEFTKYVVTTTGLEWDTFLNFTREDLESNLFLRYIYEQLLDEESMSHQESDLRENAKKTLQDLLNKKIEYSMIEELGSDGAEDPLGEESD